MGGDKSMSKFHLRLRELRNSRKLSQQELANYLQISKSSVNMYERGEREPGLDTLEAIADFFNVDMDYLSGKATEIKIFDTKDDITSHEREIINAYREQSESVKTAICKMLDVEYSISETIKSSKHTEKKPQVTTIYRAARSVDNHPAEIVETTKDFSKIPPTENKNL